MRAYFHDSDFNGRHYKQGAENVFELYLAW